MKSDTENTWRIHVKAKKHLHDLLMVVQSEVKIIKNGHLEFKELRKDFKAAAVRNDIRSICHELIISENDLRKDMETKTNDFINDLRRDMEIKTRNTSSSSHKLGIIV